MTALAALLAASATPAAACDFFACMQGALADDSYPVSETPLPPTVRALVVARHDGGMSLAGFYNDPSLALAAGYEPAPPPLAETSYVEAPQADYGERRHAHGPHVIMSPYGHGRHHIY